MNRLNYLNKPYFDHGALNQISIVIRELGIKKPLICSDPGLMAIGMTDKISPLLFLMRHLQTLLKRQLKKPASYTKKITVMELSALVEVPV